jgi:hypothetical protein
MTDTTATQTATQHMPMPAPTTITRKSQKKLDIKAWELRISDGSAACEACHRTIPAGSPAIVHRTVNVNKEGELVVVEHTGCFCPCAGPRQGSERSELPAERHKPEIRSEWRKPPLPQIRSEWANLPDEALPEHQAGFPIWNLSGEKIATGYKEIIELDGDISFLECAEPQVVRTMFTHLPGESDRYGTWMHMQTPSRFYGRKYLRSNGDFLAGHWYFRLNLIKPARAQAQPA